jgi:hypothetical protein
MKKLLCLLVFLGVAYGQNISLNDLEGRWVGDRWSGGNTLSFTIDSGGNVAEGWFREQALAHVPAVSKEKISLYIAGGYVVGQEPIVLSAVVVSGDKMVCELRDPGYSSWNGTYTLIRQAVSKRTVVATDSGYGGTYVPPVVVVPAGGVVGESGGGCFLRGLR